MNEKTLTEGTRRQRHLDLLLVQAQDVQVSRGLAGPVRICQKSSIQDGSTSDGFNHCLLRPLSNRSTYACFTLSFPLFLSFSLFHCLDILQLPPRIIMCQSPSGKDP